MKSETNSQPSREALRHFGLTMAAALVLMFGLVLPWLFGFAVPLWPWIAAGVFLLIGLAAPNVLAPVHRLWMKFALLLGAINSRIILGLVYFFIFVPVSLLFRLVGRDTMARRFDSQAPSYRVDARVRAKEDLEKPF